MAESRYTMHTPRPVTWGLALLSAWMLSACGGDDTPVVACAETGPYACKTGDTEPLYPFQWALKYQGSYFAQHADAGAFGGGYDLNVEPVHRQGIKGQGINVLVLDTGVDLEHPDLKPNASYAMSWNFETNTSDPAPPDIGEIAAHGTAVAGIIGAAQNGQGTMGIAPRVTLSAVPLFGADMDKNSDAIFGGAPWSRAIDVVNASSYWAQGNIHRYSVEGTPYLSGNAQMKRARDGKGIVYVKSAGNSFSVICPEALLGYFDCFGSNVHPESLEPNTVMVASLSAKGQAGSYSTAGPLLWVTGLGGERATQGEYGGEVSGRTPAEIAAGGTGGGPQIFTTDLRGCDRGFSNTQADTPFLRGETARPAGVKNNLDCQYTFMSGTSSAAPTISGVAALALSANPQLTWRDVREILRLSSRQIDPDYVHRTRDDINRDTPIKLEHPYGALFDLTTNTFTAHRGTAAHLVEGATRVPVELGWQTNAAGLTYSNWYGFGLPDAEKAVALAQAYARNPSRSLPSAQAMPDFTTLAEVQGFTYGQVTQLARFEADDTTVDQFQVRIDGSQLCLGAIGFMAESPAGTKSLLKMPLDQFAAFRIDAFQEYGMGSYAFHGESAKGTWKIYAVASNPSRYPGDDDITDACDALPEQGLYRSDARLRVQARMIAR